MKTSRQQVLDYLRVQRAASAAELSQALQMTAANVRHHLTILEQQGLIERSGWRISAGRGRPAQVFCLSEQARGHNLERLASVLLTACFGLLPGEPSQAILERLVQLLIPTAPAGSLTQRLNSTVRTLNEMHYEARWEAHAEAPRLILSHCPYATLPVTHPELCRLDALLIEKLLHSSVQSIARLTSDIHGAPFCAFRILRH